MTQPMTEPTNGERLGRYNVLFTDSESEWLDRLAEEIHTATGAKVSRSESQCISCMECQRPGTRHGARQHRSRMPGRPA